MQIEPQFLAIIVAILTHAFASVWFVAKLAGQVEHMTKAIDSLQLSIKEIWNKIEKLSEEQIKLSSKGE